MTSSTLLTLPLLEAAQAQKHVTHNDALQVLDRLVQLMVLDKDLTAPPGSPAEGDRYIVAGSPTGAWSGQAGKVAAWQDGAWTFSTPREGWMAWASDEDRLYVYSGSAWLDYDSVHKLLGILTPFGGALQIKCIEQTTTLSGATTDAATPIPIGTIKAVSMRVTTAITGATSFDMGDGSTVNKFGGTLGISAGSTNRGHIGPTGYYSGSDPLRFTANGGVFVGGVVRSNIWYLEWTPPTS